MKWRLGKPYDNRRDEIEDDEGRCIAIVWTRRGPERATAFEQFKPDPYGQANASLMIAAPALLEALRWIKNDLAYKPPEDVEPTIAKKLTARIDREIANATGSEVKDG